MDSERDSVGKYFKDRELRSLEPWEAKMGTGGPALCELKMRVVCE